MYTLRLFNKVFVNFPWGTSTCGSSR